LQVDPAAMAANMDRAGEAMESGAADLGSAGDLVDRALTAHDSRVGRAFSAPVVVHHVVEGGPDAPVVILVHAIGTSLEMWQPQVEALGRAFRVVRYDQRGHGRSPVPVGPYTLDDLGIDLLALMDRLGIERASLCGLSLGGMTALWVAAHAPERVERVVACCVTARPALPGAWADRAATVRREGVAAIEDLVLERWGYRERNPELGAVVLEMLRATPDEGYAACCDAVRTMNLEPDLARITAPVLLLAGSEDPAAPPSAMAGVAAAIPGAQFRVVEGAAHLANVEQPDAVTAAILDHLRPVHHRRPT
jgi:3-oxoadipate enol-lactonase